MDLLGGTAINVQQPPALFDGAVEVLVGGSVMAVMLYLEVTRRGHAHTGAPGTEEGTSGGLTLKGCTQLLCRFWGEALGIAACVAVAVALRVWGSRGAPVAAGSHEERAWADIQRQWPLLVTADTLLAFQSMLRVTAFFSVTLRSGTDDSGPPLAAEPAALLLAGGLFRAALLAQSDVYMLDGPLGGSLPASCDVAAIPLLLPLALPAILSLRRCLAFMLIVVCCGWFGYHNRLSLSEDPVADSLFTGYHVLDLAAAVAHLGRTAFTGGGLESGGWIVQTLMPVQQGLAAYYFLMAFDAAPELVSAGKPFELLQYGGVAQLGMFLASAALHLSELAEGCVGGVAREPVVY